MEVHSHTHTARKKWTHYFWEFLMLFLAVFCGFLAENQREHFVEAHRAKEYAKGLLSDIQLDTGQLRRGINTTKFTISSIDSIVSISKDLSSANSIPGTFYYYSKFISYSFLRSINWFNQVISGISGTKGWCQLSITIIPCRVLLLLKIKLTRGIEIKQWSFVTIFFSAVIIHYLQQVILILRDRSFLRNIVIL